MMDKSLASSQPQVCGICMECSPYSLSYYFINTILISLLLQPRHHSHLSLLPCQQGFKPEEKTHACSGGHHQKKCKNNVILDDYSEVCWNVDFDSSLYVFRIYKNNSDSFSVC